MKPETKSSLPALKSANSRIGAHATRASATATNASKREQAEKDAIRATERAKLDRFHDHNVPEKT